MRIIRFLGIAVIGVMYANISLGQLLIEQQTDGVLIKEDAQNVLFFQKANKSLDGKYSRCNYIHPLWNLNGDILTEDFPEDHLHHRGIFWSWHQVWIGNKRIGDPWLLQDFEQNVVDLKAVEKNGRVKIQSEVNWLSNKWKRNGKKVPYLRENAEVQIYPQNSNVRRIDFCIRLTALEDSLYLGGSEDTKGYGGFSARLRLVEGIGFSDNNGNVEPQRNAIDGSGYMIISNPKHSDLSEGGLVIIDNPANLSYPQSWILRRSNSMQNVVFPGNEPVLVQKSEPLILRYTLLVFSGKISKQKIKDFVSEL